MSSINGAKTFSYHFLFIITLYFCFLSLNKSLTDVVQTFSNFLLFDSSCSELQLLSINSITPPDRFFSPPFCIHQSCWQGRNRRPGLCHHSILAQCLEWGDSGGAEGCGGVSAGSAAPGPEAQTGQRLASTSLWETLCSSEGSSDMCHLFLSDTRKYQI